MRFKVDENLPQEVAAVLRSAGHDALTLLDQGAAGSPDAVLATLLQRERRALLTLDLGFGDIRLYPPDSTQASWSCT
jgi:predicted nuclease of predicted toxin-antitoxin system